MARGVKRTSIETRNCNRCGNEFERNRKYSAKQWTGALWCSRKCAIWNSGLTKADDPRLLAISELVRISAKGRPGWSKGLTKHTHPILAIVARKVSETQKGKTINDAQRASLAVGRTWATGRTSANCPNIAAGAVKRADKMRGRSNPAQSERLKLLHAKYPEKHPNAIVAKKTKGKGHTYIEKIVADILTEQNIVFAFNVRVGSKWPDFSIPSHGLIVEADGEYWHQDAVKEAVRDAYFTSLGWRILHLTGKQLVNETDKCRVLIASALERASV